MQQIKPHAIIKNKTELVSHGLSRLRSDALEIIQHGISVSNPGAGTYRNVRVAGEDLHIGRQIFHLRDFENIYVVGAGKGSYPIAEALEDILGHRITDGVVIVKREERRRLKRIEVCEAGHPIPDEDSVIGARKIQALIAKANQNDLVFAAVTGGSSALVTLPPDGIPLQEIKDLTDMLLKCGAVIREINIVRKHLCGMKGGQLVAQIQPAQAVTLTLDTQPEGMPWPDMSLADPSTFQDAIDVLHHYDLWHRVSTSIRDYLEYAKTKPELETVKSLDGMRTFIVSVGDPVTACEASAQKARELGYTPAIISTNIEGEAKDLGICFSGITREILKFGRPFQRPCALISSGEATVTLSENFGEGGPNQEFVLGFASNWNSDQKVVCVAVDTDGTDGPTEIAGGIIDSQTMNEARDAGVMLADYLKNHESKKALLKFKNAIITGHTGTNVNDLRLILIG